MATVNPDDEIFWSKVRDAYNLVVTNHEREVEFTAGNRQATVSWWGSRNNDAVDTLVIYDCVMIEIVDHTPPQPMLIVPASIQGDD